METRKSTGAVSKATRPVPEPWPKLGKSCAAWSPDTTWPSCSRGLSGSSRQHWTRGQGRSAADLREPQRDRPPLTESEKVKNWLLMGLTDEGQQDLYDNHWLQIERTLGT